MYCEHLPPDAVSNLVLYDAKGSKVLSAQITGPIHKLDVAQLNGVYTAVVQHGERIHVGKVTVQ